MKRYAIAEYLTPEQKRAICTARYTREHPMQRQLRADGLYCPLGVLARDRLIEWPYCPSAPDAETVAYVLADASPYASYSPEWDAQRAQIECAAAEFIDAWDAGALAPADLPAALGYPPAGAAR